MSQSSIDDVVSAVALNFALNKVPDQMGIDILKLTLDNDAVITETNSDTVVQMRADFIGYGNAVVAALEEQGCSHEDALAGMQQLVNETEEFLKNGPTAEQQAALDIQKIIEEGSNDTLH